MESSPLYTLYGYGLRKGVFPPLKMFIVRWPSTWNFWWPKFLSISTFEIYAVRSDPNQAKLSPGFSVSSSIPTARVVWPQTTTVWWVYGRLIKEDFAIRVFGKKKVKRERNRKQSTSPKTNSLSLDKLAVGKLLSSLGRSIFRGCVGFRERKGWSIFQQIGIDYATDNYHEHIYKKYIQTNIHTYIHTCMCGYMHTHLYNLYI